MVTRVRKKEGEDFSKATVQRVITLLEQAKPITKKAACDMLHIAYNTTRLNKIVSQRKDDDERISKRKKELRGTAITDVEKSYIISAYLAEASIQDIVDTSFRSPLTIARILKEYHIPARQTTKNFESIILPDEGIQEDYKKDDLVFSAKYNTTAKIGSCQGDGIYRIWIYGIYQQWAYQPYWELSSLTKVQKDLGVDMEDMPAEEIHYLINIALANAKKMKNVQN